MFSAEINSQKGGYAEYDACKKRSFHAEADIIGETVPGGACLEFHD
jgi:hypothetical protein